MVTKTDILVLGATGFTGRLLAKHLNNHRDRTSFTFALAARSKSKLAALADELGLNAQIPLLNVDVTQQDQVEEVVKSTRVVINVVGPYWTWGTPIVRACVKHNVHYVDLTGETPWIRDIIHEYDYAASKNHTVILPSCGFDSIPSDLSAYLSVQKLKEHLGPNTEVGRSVTSHKVKGGISGGTLTSAYVYLEVIPRQKVLDAAKDHSLSPAIGAASPPFQLSPTLPHVKPTIVGALFPMALTNRAIVLRTRGLLEVTPVMKAYRYGPQFTYDEFFVVPNRITGIVTTLVTLFATWCLTKSSFARWVFKRVLVDNVHGPSDKAMEKGFLKLNNVTSSIPTESTPETTARTIIRIRGDPGYLVTTIMQLECALALLDTSKLTPLGQEGGVLTAVSALGNELPKRLEATGRVEIECSILPP